MRTKKKSKARSIELCAAILLAAMLVTLPFGIFAQAADPVSPAVLTGYARVSAMPSLRITVYCDGMVKMLDFSEGTVGSLIKAHGITVGPNDRVTPAEASALTAGMTITITRATVKTVTADEIIPRSAVYIANEYLPRGTEKVLAEGSDGARTVIYEIVTCGNVEISRRAVSVTVTAEPTDRVVEYGPGGTIVTDSGKVIHWSHKIDGQATAYTTEGYRSKTNALGRIARPGTIAVDPKVIPLKSSVYVEGPNGIWTYGEAVAEDTGGAVKGNIIDLYFTTRTECFQFGRKACTIYVLESV